MSTITSVSSQALQYVQTNLQTQNASQVKAKTDPVQAVQPTVPATGNDVQSNKNNSVGGKLDTYA